MVSLFIQEIVKSLMTDSKICFGFVAVEMSIREPFGFVVMYANVPP